MTARPLDTAHPLRSRAGRDGGAACDTGGEGGRRWSVPGDAVRRDGIAGFAAVETMTAIPGVEAWEGIRRR
ncbi:MAG: hypothetical protein M3Q03_07235 [Chloroflexota bacterium]|nr:hypothetical protein [Chloroflexota bacterium]